MSHITTEVILSYLMKREIMLLSQKRPLAPIQKILNHNIFNQFNEVCLSDNTYNITRIIFNEYHTLFTFFINSK